MAKLGYREQRELERLPGEMERLAGEIKALEERLADPGLYGRDRPAFEAAAARREILAAKLSAAEARWLELEQRRESLIAAETGNRR